MELRAYYADPERYEAEIAGISEDQRWYLRRATELGGPVLELGCGTGRILLPIAAAGVPIDGLDSSPAMLDAARGRLLTAARDVALRVNLFEGDMRRFALGPRYRCVLAPLNTLMHLHTDAELLECLGCAREHLIDGGRLLLDLANPLPEFLEPTGDDRGVPLRRIRVRGEWYLQRERHRHDPTTRISHTDMIFEPLVESAAPFTCQLRLRHYPPAELDRLLHQAGFEVISRHGNFREAPFDAQGPVQVVEAGRTRLRELEGGGMV